MDAEDGARGGAPSTSAMSPDGAGPAADPPVFSTVLVYATSARVYVVAGTSDKSRWRILNVSRALNADDSLEASEDPGEYDEAHCARVLATIAAGNASAGGMTLVARGRALVGTLRILDAHYLLLITERKRLGRVRGHDVFGVGATELVRIAVKAAPTDGPPPVFSTSSSKAASRAASAPASGEEKRLKKLLAWVDLSRGCFYSHTYGLTATLQSNVLDADAASRARRDFDSPFAWNAHVSLPLRYAVGGAAAARWLVPLVHGFFERRRVSLLGRRLEITLIARRSRHFAGTRYRRRGVNARGRVANEVETEQIVDAAPSRDSRRVASDGARTASFASSIAVSSAVQMRGSIPVFWSQEASVVAARPTIVLDAPSCSARTERFRTDATATHFDLCEARYGAPVVALSLIKANERRRREGTLRDALIEALEAVNEARLEAGRERVACVHWDFAGHMRREGGAARRSKAAPRDDATSKTTDGAPADDASTSTSTTLGLTRLARVAAGALELVGVFAVGPAVALEAASARHARETRGGAAARAADAWRAAECELVTGLADGRPGGAGASASPWRVAFVSFASASAEDGDSDAAVPARPRDELGLVTQRGALRSHCVDCLDRTNVAQFAWGLAALGAQLEALGLADGGALSLDGSFAGELFEMYRAMGDALAVQYGGSEAHAKAGDVGNGSGKRTDGGSRTGGNGDETIFPYRRRGARDASGGVGVLTKYARRLRDAAASSSAKMLVSARRFYSNAYTDADKQEGIDVFLGAHPGTSASRCHLEEDRESVGRASDATPSPPSPPSPPRRETKHERTGTGVFLNWALLRGASSRAREICDASDDDDDAELDGTRREGERVWNAKGVSSRSADDGWVSLRALSARVRANPVRLDGEKNENVSRAEAETFAGLANASRLDSPSIPDPDPRPRRAAPRVAPKKARGRSDPCSAFFPDALSAEDARVYAAFAAGGGSDETHDAYGATGDDARDSPDPPEWSETAAAAEYAANEAAARDVFA